MRRHLCGGQRGTVNGDLVHRAGKVVGPAVPSRANGPIALINRQGPIRSGSYADLSSIAIKPPVGAVIGTDQMHPIPATEVGRWGNRGHIVETGAQTISEGGGAESVGERDDHM